MSAPTLHQLTRLPYNKALLQAFVEQRKCWSFKVIFHIFCLCRELINQYISSIAVPPATSVSQTSASMPSQTTAAGTSSSNLPLSSSVGNGTSSGSANANPSATVPSSPPANIKSEGCRAVSSGFAIVLVASSVIYFVL